MIALKDVRLADGPRMLFDGVDLGLEPGVRACLVGRNGAGKSTLLRILAGQTLADGGDRFVTPGARVVLLAQEPTITGQTLLDYATAGGAAVYEAQAALQTFGVDPDRATKGLSGGEARRTALARALAEQPDVLLLDEPTNHLDIFAIQTLEDELRARRMALLIVSHDRAFLERTTQRCFWLEDRRIWRLDKGFADFEPWADKISADQAETLRRLNKAIERETYWFHRSITAQRTRNEGRARELAAMREQRSMMLRDQTGTMAMTAQAGAASGQRVIEARGITKRFGDRTLIENFSTRVQRRDRIAIVGPNGAGKTTLVKLLLGEIAPDEGSVKLGSNLAVAYVDQARDTLKGQATLWEVLTPSGGDQVMVQGVPRHVAAYARDFLFQDSQLRQPVSSLSGGERNRLLLAKALAQTANLLVLDEPTNDLDMDTLDLLEDILADYAGTLILVSHDRDFIDRLATSTIALDGEGSVVETPGGWKDFLGQNPGFFAMGRPGGGKPAAGKPAAGKPAAGKPASGKPASGKTGKAAAPVAPPPAPAKRGAKLSFKDQHRLTVLEALTPKLAADIAALEKRLEDPGLYARDPAGFDKIMHTLGKTRAELAAAEDEWLALEEKREG